MAVLFHLHNLICNLILNSLTIYIAYFSPIDKILKCASTLLGHRVYVYVFQFSFIYGTKIYHLLHSSKQSIYWNGKIERKDMSTQVFQNWDRYSEYYKSKNNKNEYILLLLYIYFYCNEICSNLLQSRKKYLA